MESQLAYAPDPKGSFCYDRDMDIHELQSYDNTVITQLDHLLPQVTSHNGRISNSLPRIIENPNSALFVVKNDKDRIVGMAIVNIYQKAYYREGRLDDVVIDEQYRGQGLSKLLVTKTIEWAKTNGASAIELASRPQRKAANNLYKTLGFRQRETNVFKLDLE